MVWKNNNVHKQIKNIKKIGNDLPKSLIAISKLAQTHEPTISANAYKKFTNAKAVKMKETTIARVKSKDTFLCDLSAVDNIKLSLSKNFFILPFLPSDEVAFCSFIEIEVF